MATLDRSIQQIRKTAAQLWADNATLESGQLAIESDTKKGKIGPGAFRDLPYADFNVRAADADYANDQRDGEGGGVGTDELTADELAAINGAASPSADNVFATDDDLTTGLATKENLFVQFFRATLDGTGYTYRQAGTSAGKPYYTQVGAGTPENEMFNWFEVGGPTNGKWQLLVNGNPVMTETNAGNRATPQDVTAWTGSVAMVLSQLYGDSSQEALEGLAAEVVSQTISKVDGVVGIIDDVDGPIIRSYMGFNDYLWDTSDDTSSATINIANADSDVTVNAGLISFRWTGDTAPGIHAPGAIWGLAGRLMVRATEIVLRDSGQNDGEYVIGWVDGDMHISADIIKSDEAGNAGGIAGVQSPPITTGEFWVKANRINTNVAMQCPGSNARMWVEAMDISITNSGQSTVYASGGRFYVEAMRIKNAAADGVAVRNEGGILWLSAQKVTASGSSGQGISCIDGTTIADVLQIEDDGGLGAAIFCDFGTHTIRNTQYKSGATGNGVVMNGGTLTLENCTIDTSANDSTNPIIYNGGTLILSNCTLIAEDSRESIVTSGTVTVLCNGTKIYQPLGSGVTVRGSAQLDLGPANDQDVQRANANGTWSWGA